MSKQRIRYYTADKRNGRGFWQPTPIMRLQGFCSVPCGPDGPDAWAIAEMWNSRWDAVRRGEAPSPAQASSADLSTDQIEALTIYPRRSVGRAFQEFRQTEEWKRKTPRTRGDWERCWKRIKPVFGDCDPRTVTLAAISAWRQAIEETVSLREAHRCVKIWPALWKVMGALKYCDRDADPSLGVRNTAAKGRSETWTEGEAARIFKGAWRGGYYGLATLVATAWDTQLSPGDTRALRASQLAKDASGSAFFADRAKTGTPVGGALSGRALRAMYDYFEKLGVELHGDAYIFRTRSGARLTARTPWAMTFVTFALRSLGNATSAPSPTSVEVECTKPSPARRRPPPWHTLWATRSAPLTRCSPPIARSISRPFAASWTLAVEAGLS